mgnify:CR=1 FL=1
MSLLEQIIKVLEDKKAIDIKKVDIKDKTTIADYFVIASGTSSTHIKALADNVEENLKEQGIKPVKIEGYNSGTWILMDYSDVIVHIFTEEEREHYNLEDLWEKIDKK